MNLFIATIDRLRTGSDKTSSGNSNSGSSGSCINLRTSSRQDMSSARVASPLRFCCLARLDNQPKYFSILRLLSQSVLGPLESLRFDFLPRPSVIIVAVVITVHTGLSVGEVFAVLTYLIGVAQNLIVLPLTYQQSIRAREIGGRIASG